jgi:drug/metabolite transporter (DMT)-like permease
VRWFSTKRLVKNKGLPLQRATSVASLEQDQAISEGHNLPIVRPRMALTVGVLAVSTAAVFIRSAEAPGVVIALYRMLFASLVLAPFTLRALKRTPLSLQNAPYTILAGLCLAAHFATWISSLSYTSVTASAALVNTNPLWMALFSWLFLGLAPPLTVLLGAVLAVLGGALISFDGSSIGSQPALGNSLALVGAVAVSAYLLLGRAAQRRGLSLPAYVGSAYAVAALALLPLPLVFDLAYAPYPLLTWIWLILLALVPQLIGHTSFNYAMNHVSPTLVATIILLEPIGAALLALIVFTEVPSLLTAIGAGILLVGVILTARNNRSNSGDTSTKSSPESSPESSL